MAIYNKAGQRIYLPHSYDEDEKYTYDSFGNVVFPYDICVMTYNVQWFQDFNSQTQMQKEIIGGYSPDIIGLQELSRDGAMPAVGLDVLKEYYTILSDHKNYLGMASKRFILRDVEAVDFESQDPEDMSAYQETRAYMKAYFDFENRQVCWLNTHLALTEQYKIAQFEELLDIVEQEEYFILTGDFNINGADPSSYEYESTFKVCEELGYNLANCGIKNGTIKTHTTKTTPTSEDDFNGAPDSIITSNNIKIKARTVDFTKLRFLNGINYLDHVPVIAFLGFEAYMQPQEAVLSTLDGSLTKISGSVDSRVNNSDFPNKIRWNDTNSNRAGAVTLSGVSPYKKNSTKEDSSYYPIPVPDWAKYIYVDSSSENVPMYITFIQYNDSTEKYSDPISQYTIAWGTTPIEKEIASIENLYIVLSVNTGTVNPTDITVTFRNTARQQE